MNTFSIVIPTKNRPEELRACLRSIFAQEAKPLEVVIIDQSREPQDARMAELFRSSSVRARYIYAPDVSGAAQARNRAIGLTMGSLVVFLDDDVELAPEYLREVRAVFEEDREKRIGGAGGFILNLSSMLSKAQQLRTQIFYRGPFSVERDALDFHLHPGDLPRRASRLHGCNMTVRRDVLDEVRFDEVYSGYSFGEDRDLSVLIGRRLELLWIPRARLIHKQTSRSRLDRERFCELRVISWLRFYERCVPPSLLALLCYLWLNCGFLLLLFKVWDGATVRGTRRGLQWLLAIFLRRVELREILREGWQPRSS